VNAHDQTLRCPDAETIAALAEGRLEASRLDAVLEHVERCESCMDALDTANAALHIEPTAQRERRGSTWWLAAAAVLAIAIGIAVVRERIAPREPDIAGLVALAPHSVRLVEPRLSGGFAWAPYRGPMRASGVSDAERLRLGGAAADAIDRADRDASPAAQHVAGVAILLADDPEKAFARLQAAAQRAPTDARIANDLAAACYSAALSLDRASLYPEALAAADRALRLDPRFGEALFNRALILERLGLSQEASRAWQRYLEVDPASRWSEEARRRAAQLPRTTSDSLFKRDLPRLERAAELGDRDTVLQIVRQYPQQSRAYAEAEHLGRWGEATLRGDHAQAQHALTSARAIGNALQSSSHESLLSDCVAAIDAADRSRRTILARAHQLYRQGRKSYAQRRLDDAERDLASAATELAAAKSPMADVALYFAASVRVDRHELQAAGETLRTLVRRSDEHPQYAALRAQTRWELALCGMYEDDWISSLSLLIEAESLFAQLGERANLAFVRSMLATTLMSLGRPDEAWSARIRAFGDLSAEGRADRLLISLGAAARMEQRVGRLDAARAILGVEVGEARGDSNEHSLADALVRSALVTEQQGDHAAAEALAREIRTAIARIEDPSLRERANADAEFARGILLVREQPQAAIDALTVAVRYYERHQLAAFLPETHLHLARAALRLGKAEDALADLDRGIAEVEQRPSRSTGEASASAVLDASESLFEDAIRLALDRGDVRRAFEYAERARTQLRSGMRPSHPPTIDDLRQRLRGTNTVVLHLTALPEEIAVFAISEKDVASARTPFARDRFADLGSAIERGESAPLGELYDVLVRPSEHLVDRASNVIIVPDSRMERLPFAALRDTQRKMHLVERLGVSIAPSAAMLDLAPRSGGYAAVAIALPTDAGQALPSSNSEVEEIGRLYRDTRVLATSATSYRTFLDAVHRNGNVVVHIAGHTERQRGGEDLALRFADGERVTWRAIAAAPLERQTVVVLAACATLSNSSSPYVRSLSLGAAFAAAGAGTVIGTLAPIADADARELFLSIHRQLAAGASPAEAVRRAQLDALAGGRLPAWQSIALLTRRIDISNRSEGGRS
jgi:tetratricopeptide (TPR) repeat protein